MAGISKEALEMGRHHKIEEVIIEGGVLSLSIDGRSLQINLEDVSGVLASAKKGRATRVRGFTVWLWNSLAVD